jgi:hypothetical protein
MTKSHKSITTSTWTVRDVPNESRNAARLYAKKEEKPLGLWLGETILKACGRADKQPRNLTRPTDDIIKSLQEMHARMDQLSNTLSKSWWDKVWGK